MYAHKATKTVSILILGMSVMQVANVNRNDTTTPADAALVSEQRYSISTGSSNSMPLRKTMVMLTSVFSVAMEKVAA